MRGLAKEKMKQINIGLLGAGTVGGGVILVLIGLKILLEGLGVL